MYCSTVNCVVVRFFLKYGNCFHVHGGFNLNHLKPPYCENKSYIIKVTYG